MGRQVPLLKKSSNHLTKEDSLWKLYRVFGLMNIKKHSNCMILWIGNWHISRTNKYQAGLISFLTLLIRNFSSSKLLRVSLLKCSGFILLQWLCSLGMKLMKTDSKPFTDFWNSLRKMEQILKGFTLWNEREFTVPLNVQSHLE